MNTWRMTLAVFMTGCLGFSSVALAAADGSQLSLPKGAKIGIVVFEDLQCPDCAQAHPQLLEAAKANDLPLVIHDFPITRHVWAFPAAVLARYFALKSPALGIEFRSFVFQNQKNVNPDTLREFAEKFARDHRLELPTQIDPDDTLKNLVQADFDLGKQIGLEYVPLIFVIGPANGASRAVEVTDLAKLSEVIAQMRKGPAR